jgi:hypothetical protein
MTETFDSHWLALREPFDRRARSTALATRLAQALPANPWLIDLGAGTASLFRFLAPLIGGAQSWTFVDSDSALLDAAFSVTADWAMTRGHRITHTDSTLRIHTPAGIWQMDGEIHDLANMPGDLPLREADAVVCSALLDLVSQNWIERFSRTLRVPFLAALSVDGRDAWLPHHQADALIRAGFRRDQARDKGFGRALGPAAPAVAMRLLAARGFHLLSAPSDWIIPRPALAMAHALIGGTATAARSALPAHRAAIAAWEAARHRQSMISRVAIRIGHRDILALPEKR